jgi:hypothetical protein
MSRDPRVEHFERLHRQRWARADGQSRHAGRLLLALLLVSITLGVLVALPRQEEVRAWVHQVSNSLQMDRVGILPPPQGR